MIARLHSSRPKAILAVRHRHRCSRLRSSLPAAQSAVPPAQPASTCRPTSCRWLGKYLCYALLALSLDLVWGYCGILSLGHGAFFALGGYAMGMYLMRQIGSRGVYGNPILPDFMVFLNWKELPWYWYGLDMFPVRHG
jgi:urea transport system permease protein